MPIVASRSVFSLPTSIRRVGSATAWLLLSATTAGALEVPDSVDYTRDIRPILADSCFHCHGPADDTREADLRLDERESAVADRGGYRVVAEGRPEESILLERIAAEDPDSLMPPPDSGQPRLTPDQINLIRRWIAQGAKWQDHWAFIAPVRSPLPPSKKAEHWGHNGIDSFVLEKIQQAGLTPSVEADRFSLGRRVAIDLTGLPPSIDELQQFVDDHAPDAYERYVQRLLASPAYGEHQTRFWLDAARYGDTHGMHLDNYREIWPYRDWVIRAFNENMPFDEFIIEQLAGDLLPNPTIDQRIATGFGRCNVTSSEAGSIPEELASRYAIDRVDTLGTVFLGLTVACAQCHDHKFDPVSQREFYQLYAFFNNSIDPAMDGNRKDTPPVLVLPEATHQQEWDELQAEAGRLQQALAARAKRARSDFLAWRGSERIASPASSEPISSDGLVLSVPLDEGTGDVVRAEVDGKSQSVSLPASARWTNDAPGSPALEFSKDSAISIEDAGQLAADKPFTLSFWLRTPATIGNGVVLQKQNADESLAGWSVYFSYRYDLTMSLVANGAKKDVIYAVAADSPLKSDTWFHLCIAYTGSRAVESFTLRANGKPLDLRIIGYDRIKGSSLTDPKQPLQIAPQLAGGAVSDIRIYDRVLSEEEMRLLYEEPRIKHELEQSAAVHLAADDINSNVLFKHYLNAHDTEYQQLSRKLVENEDARDRIRLASPTTLVMQERDGETPRAHVFTRGQYDQPGDEVGAGVPRVLPPLPAESPANRLALARWLTDRAHPLTARVTVNRIWQSIFGTGIVKTSEDFGTRGAPPTHQELLDWLAVELIESGWNYKHIVELIVTSSTYRQSSDRAPDRLAVDPENCLLASGPRVRLDAEVLRDQALAASGLLARKIGGPSVKPYQPSGIWEAVAFVESNTEYFHQDSGDALYRRSLYTFWKRTAPPPSLAIFNAPTRETCTVRRERTNTPLQALVLMNDPQFIEAARVLAECTLESKEIDDDRIEYMVRCIVGRPMQDAERIVLVDALQKFRDHFANDADAARELVAIGDSVPDQTLPAPEVAAWTMLASTLLNRDDVINNH